MEQKQHWFFLLVIWLLFAPVTQAAESVGRVIFAVGDITLKRDGSLQAVQQGMNINVGDSLETGDNGHVHLLMDDNGFFSLRPQSRMQLQAYHYDATNVDANRVKVLLETGVMRTSTGKAGQANKQQYRVNTPVAAIGVRGTDYTIQTTDALSRIGVRAGGVVMAPLGDSCLASAGGPCEGSTAQELFARNAGAILEARRGAEQAVITYDAPAPDEVSPPLPEEERTLLSIRRDISQGRMLFAPEQFDEDELADYEARRKRVEDYIAERSLAKMAEDLGEQGGGIILPNDAGLLKEPKVVWGRWSDFVDKGVATAATNGAGSNGATISQLLHENRRYVSYSNSVFALIEENTADRMVPSDGRAYFKLNSYEAYIKRGSYLESAGISDASLLVDFDESKFATYLKVSANSLPDPVTVVGSGDLQSNGIFRSESGAPSKIEGVITNGGQEAGMVFQHGVKDGVEAVGATNWINSGQLPTTSN